MKTKFIAVQNFNLFYGIELSGGGWNLKETDLSFALVEKQILTVTYAGSLNRFPQQYERDILLEFPDGSTYTSDSKLIGVYVTQGKLKQIE